MYVWLCVCVSVCVRDGKNMPIKFCWGMLIFSRGITAATAAAAIPIPPLLLVQNFAMCGHFPGRLKWKVYFVTRTVKYCYGLVFWKEGGGCWYRKIEFYFLLMDNFLNLRNLSDHRFPEGGDVRVFRNSRFWLTQEFEDSVQVSWRFLTIGGSS